MSEELLCYVTLVCSPHPPPSPQSVATSVLRRADWRFLLSDQLVTHQLAQRKVRLVHHRRPTLLLFLLLLVAHVALYILLHWVL